MNWKEKSLNNFTCHLSFLKKISPTHTHPLISICEFLKPYESLFLEFESFLKCDVVSMGVEGHVGIECQI